MSLFVTLYPYVNSFTLFCVSFYFLSNEFYTCIYVLLFCWMKN